MPKGTVVKRINQFERSRFATGGTAESVTADTTPDGPLDHWMIMLPQAGIAQLSDGHYLAPVTGMLLHNVNGNGRLAFWENATERIRMGDLAGNWGFTSERYGIAIGEYGANKANMTYDPTNGLRLRLYDKNLIHLRNDGTAYIGGWELGEGYLKSTTPGGEVGLSSKETVGYNDVRIWAGSTDRETAPFRVREDGSMSSTKGFIGGWAIRDLTLEDTAGVVGLNSETTLGPDVRFWAGHVTPSSAPFRVYSDGSVVASNVSITAGAKTVIDGDGITLDGDSTGYSDSAAIKFVSDSAEVLLKLYNYYDSGSSINIGMLESYSDRVNHLNISSSASNDFASSLQLSSASSDMITSCNAALSLATDNDLDTADINLYVNNNSDTNTLSLSTSYLMTSKDLIYHGALISAKNSTTYTGYIYVPLAANLTSTAWDGDARSDMGWTKIVLSSVFGAPAGIKVVKLRLFARDDATLGTAGLYFDVGPNGSAVSFSIRPIGGDVWAENVGDCLCDANGDIYYRLNASGSSTMDVYMQILGYYI